MLECPKCNKTFANGSNLKRHIENNKFPCDKTKPKVINGQIRYFCKHCSKNFSKQIYLEKHNLSEHNSLTPLVDEIEILKKTLYEKDEKLKILEQTIEQNYTSVNNNTNINGLKSHISNDQIHNDQIHNNQIHNDQIHNNQIHNDQIHNNQIFNNKYIIVNNYYTPNTEKISYAEALLRAPNLIGTMSKTIEEIFFDQDLPENHSVFLYDDNLIGFVNDNEIRIYDYSTGIINMHVRGSTIISNKFIKNELTPDDRKKYNEYFHFIKNVLNKELHEKIMTSYITKPLYIEYKKSVENITKLLSDKTDMIKNTLKNSNFVNAKPKFITPL
jgi:hypothetical protein